MKPSLPRILANISWPSDPSSLPLRQRLAVSFGAGLAIFSVGWVGSHASPAGTVLPMLASMGASTVILFAAPTSPMGNPWAVIAGHFLSGFIGVCCRTWIADTWVAAGAAVGLAILIMYLARCLHPPGGASALIPVLGGDALHDLGFRFLLLPLALNVATLLIVTPLLRRRVPPVSIAPSSPVSTATAQPVSMGISSADLREALRDIHTFVDISEDDLTRIYAFALGHAYQRKHGCRTAAEVMRPTVATAAFATELSEVWDLFRRSGHKAVVVINPARHPLGIITVTDVLRHAAVDEIDGFRSKLRRFLSTNPMVTSNKPEVAGQIMTSPVLTVRANAALTHLVPLLTEQGVRQIPVVDDRKKLVGMVTQQDLIVALYQDLAAAPDDNHAAIKLSTAQPGDHRPTPRSDENPNTSS